VSRLSTGAELRVTGTGTSGAVICVNGGRPQPVEGTWSASVEWLVGRLAPRLPDLAFAEVRYRVRSWKRLDLCIEDANAAIREVGSPNTILLGFSMGGAVAISSAGDAWVRGVLGLAPWIPDALDVTPIAGKELVVLHGALDSWLPGLPGVSRRLSRRGFERARAAGAAGRYVVVRGAVHGVALRGPWGRLVPLPRARRWEALVRDELGRLLAD
jgi:pimeloyl-ACP methyl ester carboxylesterase